MPVAFVKEDITDVLKCMPKYLEDYLGVEDIEKSFTCPICGGTEKCFYNNEIYTINCTICGWQGNVVELVQIMEHVKKCEATVRIAKRYITSDKHGIPLYSTCPPPVMLGIKKVFKEKGNSFDENLSELWLHGGLENGEKAREGKYRRRKLEIKKNAMENIKEKEYEEFMKEMRNRKGDS